MEHGASCSLLNWSLGRRIFTDLIDMRRPRFVGCRLNLILMRATVSGGGCIVDQRELFAGDGSGGCVSDLNSRVAPLTAVSVRSCPLKGLGSHIFRFWIATLMSRCVILSHFPCHGQSSQATSLIMFTGTVCSTTHKMQPPSMHHNVRVPKCLPRLCGQLGTAAWQKRVSFVLFRSIGLMVFPDDSH